MSRISISDYLAMLADLSALQERVAAYSIVAKGEGSFDVELAPDPVKIDLTEVKQRPNFENAMRMGNEPCRSRRKWPFVTA